MNHSIHASKRIHCIANAHDPGNSIWPTACTIEGRDEARVVIAIAHGEDRNSDDDEAENGYRETSLCPLSEVLLWDREDGDDYERLIRQLECQKRYPRVIKMSPT
jgi:hypothetical protein